MQEMIDFTNYVLESLVTFIQSPPIFYLFGLVCLLFVVQILKKLIGRSKI